MLHHELASYLARRNAVWPWLAQPPRVTYLEPGDTAPAVLLRLVYQSPASDTEGVESASVFVMSIGNSPGGADAMARKIEREFAPDRLPVRLEQSTVVAAETVGRYKAAALTHGKAGSIRTLKVDFDFFRRACADPNYEGL